MTDHTTLSLGRRRATALLAFACTSATRPNIIGAALRVTEHGARWEATTGAMLILIPRQKPDELQPGVYRVSIEALRRCAQMPNSIRTPEDNCVQVVPDEAPHVWPDLDQVVAKQQGVPVPAVIALDPRLVGIAMRTLSALDGRGSDRKVTVEPMGGPRDPWKVSTTPGASIQAVAYISTMRMD